MGPTEEASTTRGVSGSVLVFREKSRIDTDFLSPDVQKDIWWYFALLVLGVLLVEWYVYNRRVYI